MAVVSIHWYEPWIMGRRVLRELMRRLAAMVDLHEDRDAIETAVAVDGFMLDTMPPLQARRLGRLLAVVVDEWRAEIGDNDPPDMLGLGEHLEEVGLWLHDYDDDDYMPPAPPRRGCRVSGVRPTVCRVLERRVARGVQRSVGAGRRLRR